MTLEHWSPYTTKTGIMCLWGFPQRTSHRSPNEQIVTAALVSIDPETRTAYLVTNTKVLLGKPDALWIGADAEAERKFFTAWGRIVRLPKKSEGITRAGSDDGIRADNLGKTS